MIDNTKYMIVSNCVVADLNAVEKSDFKDINQKMQLVSPRRLETVLEMLNLGVVEEMISKGHKPKRDTTVTNEQKVIKIS